MKTAMTVLAGWVIGMAIFAPAAAWAVHPFQVEDTDVQGAGNFLFELYGDSTKYNDSRNTTIAGDLHAGVMDSADVSLQVPLLDLSPSPVTGQTENGNGDVQLAFKQRVYKNEVNQSIGYEVYGVLPAGNSSKGLGTNNFVAGFKLMDQQGCCSTIYRVSLGYESFVKDMASFHFADDYAIQLGFAVEHKITESFRLLSELNYEERQGRDNVDNALYALSIMAGAKYNISKTWYVDVGARAGLNGDAEDYAALVGTAWRF